MAKVTPPYFFDEFLRPLKRDEPTPRERELGLTLKDLDWLHTLYYASDKARQDSALRDAPMRVETLLINLPGKIDVPLAGAFMMSPSPDAAKALLYTPYGGLEVFENRKALLVDLTKNINKPSHQTDLIGFLSISQRHSITPETVLTLSTQPVDGAVLEDQERTLNACQQHNLDEMLRQLRLTPSLAWMLDTVLTIMSRAYFPGLDQRDTRMNSFAAVDAPGVPHWIASITLAEALLQFYLKQSWPAGHTRSFFNPRHVTSGFSQAQLDADLRRWDVLIEQTSSVFSKLLGSLLQTYWNTGLQGGQSRLDFFAQVMSDKFRLDLLLKRQAGILSAEASHQLLAVFLPDQSARSRYASGLRIDTVRIDAPYQHYVELAGTLMINDTHAYLYTQPRGLQVLKDLDDLKDTLLSMLKAVGHEDELLNFLSLEERSVYIGLDQVQVTGVPVVGGIFHSLAEDIVAKQQRNLEHALGLYRRSDGQVELSALLDCALDVRSMFDPRLLALETDGRWSLNPVSSHQGRPSTVRAERARHALEQLRTLERAVTDERNRHPTLRRLAAAALDAELDKHELALKADQIHINTYAGPAQEREEREPQTSLTMLDYFIEHLANQSAPLTEAPHTWFYGPREAGAAYKINSLSLATFNAVVQQVLAPFAQHDIRTLPRLFHEAHQHSLRHAMGEGLRSEAALRYLGQTLDGRAHAVIDTVLSGDSPARLTRHGLNGFLPDAYGLTVRVVPEEAFCALANAFVLTERGGTDRLHSGQALLWTPRRGHEAFASVQHLRIALNKRLRDPELRSGLLENLPVSRRVPHLAYELGPLQRIDEHLLDNRQRSYRDWVIDGIDNLLSMRLGARRLQACLDALMLRPAPNNVARAARLAETTVQQQALPAWLGMAAPEEQRRHAELLEQMRLSAPDQHDYLHGIVPLHEHVFSALTELLNARFASEVVNPDHVLIAPRLALDGHVQTLTEFAQRHLPDLQADQLQLRSSTAKPLPEALDGNAVVQMVQQLNLKQVYRQWLTTHLEGQADDMRQRRQLFCRQLPWQLLRHAHEEKLEERLSPQAWSYVQQVFDMPDGSARAAVDGATATLRPLELIATPGAVSAVVTGVYIIGPKTQASGPLVLYAPYSLNHTLKEYPHEEDLLNEINRPGPLQDWIAQHLDAAQQATYRNAWRQTARHDEIRLGVLPVSGNLLMRLFHDNATLLSKMLGCQFDATGKHLWDGVTSLLRKGIPMALQFLGGKLNFPLTVWRSYTLFKHSAEDLQQHRWGEGLKTFIQGVARLASVRLDLQAPQAPPPVPEVAVSDWLNAAAPAATTLATLDITHPQRTRLGLFEASDIALEDLKLLPTIHVYKDHTKEHYYVPVAGKVYPVKRAGDLWRLDNGEQPGPYVQRNTQGHWVLDPNLHHPRFGKSLSRFADRVNTRAAERQSINIEAVGMREIAALSSWKAQCIDEALNVATWYAVNCRRNLTAFAQLRDPDTRLGRFFTELFGVHRLTAEQVTRVENRIDAVLDELVNHTLTSPDSMRFVSGTSRWNPQHSYAFTLPDDGEQKIYLLDRFFDPKMDIYQNRLTTPFSLSAHARASTLIHELTHLRSETEDIAYLDSMRPFHDLIDVNVHGARVLKTDLTALRNTALSTLTPADMLFRTWDAYSDKWEDLGGDSQTRPVRDRILKITGAKTLEDARRIFMSNDDKRIDIILANADSVTYLLTQLGRELDQGA